MTRDKKWFEWSDATLQQYARSNVMAINPIIYSEISVGFSQIEELEGVLAVARLERLPIPWDAAFLAGKCFKIYRQRGGIRTSPLSDFFIGAHATVESMSLITRDAIRFRTYFPQLKLIAPA
jgi:predicted nucleic acid-binding protein